MTYIHLKLITVTPCHYIFYYRLYISYIMLYCFPLCMYKLVNMLSERHSFYACERCAVCMFRARIHTVGWSSVQVPTNSSKNTWFCLFEEKRWRRRQMVCMNGDWWRYRNHLHIISLKKRKNQTQILKSNENKMPFLLQILSVIFHNCVYNNMYKKGYKSVNKMKW